MRCSWLLVLGLLQNFAHSLEILGSGEEPTSVIAQNVTGVLGDYVYLSCEFQGKEDIQKAEWKRKISLNKFKRLAGFANNKSFSHFDDFSKPPSSTNLTVRMRVSNVEAEGEYLCEFEDKEENSFGSVFVTVYVKPDIQIMVNSETINDIHYQMVSCSAIGGKPTPHISWLVGGQPPSGFPFTVNESKTLHSNSTSTLHSILSFPTHLQEEDSVTCVVKHETLPSPKSTTTRVKTYVRPNVTIKAEMVEHGGNDFWVVSCISSGGRPEADISLALNGNEEVQRDKTANSDMKSLSVRLAVAEHEGHSITCVFRHPKFSHPESRNITLPTFYLSGVHLSFEGGNSSNGFNSTEFLELQEGDRDVVFTLKVTGNVPRYIVDCKKDDRPLPEDVKLIGRDLIIRGPVTLQHSGLYECDCSYHHLKATMQVNITVQAQPPQMVSPTIRVDSHSEGEFTMIECSATGAVPAASVSWSLPEGVSEDFWSNSTFNNGSHTVLLLPACLPLELTAVCVINHPTFKETENRSIILSHCARPNVTITLSSEWKDSHKYSTVICLVVSVASAAAISWRAGNKDDISYAMNTDFHTEGLVSTHSSVHFKSSLYAGQNLTCIVKHPSLVNPEKRTIHIPVNKPPHVSVSVVRQKHSPLWLAVCDCKGEGVGTNLAWDLPENVRNETTLHTEYKGHIMNAKLTYQFPLFLHEGQGLTCVYKSDNGITERKTIPIPKYYISSVKVLNNTSALKNHHADQAAVYRVSVNENQPNQKVLLRVEGNMPDYSLECRRSDGSTVPMDGDTMILHSDPSGQTKGLYCCLASFYHHNATVDIQVEVLREGEQFMLVILICISSASAVLIVFIVILYVCCW
ncbi:uncharacterized protein si:ch211-149e23.4 [Cyprinodon tularosa]|uniref:uncharacterized protein si:ch211-149e23.4 n=1 Tax=Cyprinodon tularosa TaxID=77115 RepID=UPI0018E28B13|nr:uncharacterized protein si:ch211-149e23.4 [Cyprinodon tularosa]